MFVLNKAFSQTKVSKKTASFAVRYAHFYVFFLLHSTDLFLLLVMTAGVKVIVKVHVTDSGHNLTLAYEDISTVADKKSSHFCFVQWCLNAVLFVFRNHFISAKTTEG